MVSPLSRVHRSPLIRGIALAWVLVACIGQAVCPTIGPDPIEHPTGARDIVLRMSHGGGLLPMGMRATQLPQFTLYGDGTVIFKQLDTREGLPFGERAALPLLVAHLDETAVQALLRVAFDTGCLATARDRYDNPQIFDAGTTTFTLNAGGLQKVVSVYALSQSIPGPDPAERFSFLQLVSVLDGFRERDDLGEVKPFDPDFYRVTLLEGSGGPSGVPLAWPWDDLTLYNWNSTDDPHLRVALLSRDQVMKLLVVPNGGHIGVWVTAPGGEPAQLAVRPLLPEEEPVF
jgi:hypothetical protein